MDISHYQLTSEMSEQGSAGTTGGLESLIKAQEQGQGCMVLLVPVREVEVEGVCYDQETQLYFLCDCSF